MKLTWADQLRKEGVQLTAGDLKRIDEAAPKGVAAGMRYPEAMMAAVNR